MNAMTINQPVTVGAPICLRGERGFVCKITQAEGDSFVLGTDGLNAVALEYEICWDSGRISELPDGVAARGLADARAMGLPHVEDIEERVAAARQAMQDARLQREEAERARREARAAFEADAAKRIPRGAKAVIVAEYEIDDCDSMSDYFATKTGRVIILGFSTHGRDLFPEMRKAALNHPETAFLAEAPESAEHRDKHSMGAGYYLKATNRYSTGWRIKKYRFYRDKPEQVIPSGEWSLSAPAPERKESTADAPTVAAGGFRIEEHTHTKKQFQMFIVILPGRVERDEFDRLRNLAQAAGGWYSRPWGSTPGGFAFRDRDKAESFVASCNG